MQRFAIFPLLGPALVLYLIADVASSRGSFDPFEYALAGVAVWLSFARRGDAVASDAPRTAQLLGWLGLCAAVALLRLLSIGPPRLAVDVTEGAALASAGAVVLELALTVPNPIVGRRWAGWVIALAWLIALSCVALSALSLGSSVTLFGKAWLLPAAWDHAPAFYAVCALALALGLRFARRRSGTAEELWIANSWGMFGLAPALLFSVSMLAIPRVLPSWFVHGWAALAAYTLYAGHALAIDARRRMAVSFATRDGAAAVGTVAAIASAAASFRHAIPDLPLARGLWVGGTLLVALALFALLRQGLRVALVPEGGQLLDALVRTQSALGRAQTLESLVQLALAGLRSASGATSSKPLIYAFDPPLEAAIDAAGAAHVNARLPHPALFARLRERPGDLILRAELADQLVRQPALRALFDVLAELDALCVVPLVVEGELEGALLLPRAGRKSPLAAEEQRALWEFSRYLGGLLAVFSAKARAEQRANAASLAATRALAEIETLKRELDGLRADRELLQSERPRRAEAGTLVAYSAPQRALHERLQGLAKERSTVLLLCEPGVAVEALARVLHAGAARNAPFVVFDCAAVRAEQVEAALFGGVGPLGPEVGCLRVAADGTLLLLDLPALPLVVQQQLASALAASRAASGGSDASYPVHARIVASARNDVRELAEQGRFSEPLAAQLAAIACRVPPLRECGDDLTSLTLLAIDRACRRHGRGPIGIDGEALDELRAYDFPGNHLELEHVIDRAVAHARGARLTQLDFAVGRLLAARSGEDILSGPLEQLERKALLSALIRAGGNKSEAARLLGLPRSTLQDKLRRHALEDSALEIPRPN